VPLVRLLAPENTVFDTELGTILICFCNVLNISNCWKLINSSSSEDEERANAHDSPNLILKKSVCTLSLFKFIEWPFVFVHCPWKRESHLSHLSPWIPSNLKNFQHIASSSYIYYEICVMVWNGRARNQTRDIWYEGMSNIWYIITPLCVIFNNIDSSLDCILLQFSEQAPLFSNFCY